MPTVVGTTKIQEDQKEGNIEPDTNEQTLYLWQEAGKH